MAKSRHNPDLVFSCLFGHHFRLLPQNLKYCQDRNDSAEKCFQELISQDLLTLLRDRPRLELIIVSSNFQAFLSYRKIT